MADLKAKWNCCCSVILIVLLMLRVSALHDTLLYVACIKVAGMVSNCMSLVSAIGLCIHAACTTVDAGYIEILSVCDI